MFTELMPYLLSSESYVKKVSLSSCSKICWLRKIYSSFGALLQAVAGKVDASPVWSAVKLTFSNFCQWSVRSQLNTASKLYREFQAGQEPAFSSVAVIAAEVDWLDRCALDLLALLAKDKKLAMGKCWRRARLYLDCWGADSQFWSTAALIMYTVPVIASTKGALEQNLCYPSWSDFDVRKMLGMAMKWSKILVQVK